MSVNRVILLGNLTRDPEMRYAPSGSAVANTSIATNRAWKDKTSGERKEEVEFHRVVFYDKLAEIAGEYLKKGRPVYVEGRLKTRKWQDKDGKDVYTTEIVAEQMQMLGGREDGDQAAPRQGQQQRPAQRPASGGGNSYANARAGRTSAPAQAPAPSGAGSGFDDMDDDVPF